MTKRIIANPPREGSELARFLDEVLGDRKVPAHIRVLLPIADRYGDAERHDGAVIRLSRQTGKRQLVQAMQAYELSLLTGRLPEPKK